MKTETVLKKLYELQKLSGEKAEDYIAKWIFEVKVEIAEESKSVVDSGDRLKTLIKIIKANIKAGNGLAGFMKASKRNRWVLTNKYYAILAKNSMNLPEILDRKDDADIILWKIDAASKVNTKAYPLPMRSTLDSIIKDWKAQPKSERTEYPLYSFGDDLPSVNAEYLFDLMAIFKGGTVMLCPDNKRAPLYFRHEELQGILLPIRK